MIGVCLRLDMEAMTAATGVVAHGMFRPTQFTNMRGDDGGITVLRLCEKLSRLVALQWSYERVRHG